MEVIAYYGEPIPNGALSAADIILPCVAHTATFNDVTK